MNFLACTSLELGAVAGGDFAVPELRPGACAPQGLGPTVWIRTMAPERRWAGQLPEAHLGTFKSQYDQREAVPCGTNLRSINFPVRHVAA